MYTQRHQHFHTSFVHFPHKKQSDEGKAQPLFPKVPIFIMELAEKPQLGLGFKEADFTLWPYIPPTVYQWNTWNMCGNVQKRQEKVQLIYLCIIHKGISFSKYLHTSSFTRFLADFSPAATGLRQTVRHRLRWYFDPVNNGSVTLFKTVTHARLWQILRGLWLRAWWSGRLGFFPP